MLVRVYSLFDGRSHVAADAWLSWVCGDFEFKRINGHVYQCHEGRWIRVVTEQIEEKDQRGNGNLLIFAGGIGENASTTAAVNDRRL